MSWTGWLSPMGGCGEPISNGIFDNDQFRRSFLQDLHERSGRTSAHAASAFSYRQWKEEQYDHLAEAVRRHCDVERIYRLVGLC